MTILVMFHQSQGYRNFKGYYTEQVLGHWHREFPDAPSYTRVVQLLPRVLWPLVHYLGSRRGEVSGISFVDSTPLKVCHHARIHSHKVFQGLAQRGKSSTGWFFGFKLHLIINDRSELLGVRLTPGNVDDRLPVPEMAKGLFGKLFGDRGYISQALRDTLKQQGVELITKLRKNMKPKLLNLMDKILLRKRALIETVNDQLKNVCQIEHSRHRSPINAFVHLIAGWVAFTWQEKRLALSWTREEQEILNAHKQLVCAQGLSQTHVRIRSVIIPRVISRAPSSLKSESTNMTKTSISDASISFTP